MTGGESGGELRQEIYIEAPPSAVFMLLTDATRMMSWLAEVVETEPRPGGHFRISESGGTTIAGTYVEVVPDRKVVFTWGGVMGLAPGQTTVEFVLEPVGSGTRVKLRQFGLPGPAVEPHVKGWVSGLQKLKSAGEGRDPGGLCLGDATHPIAYPSDKDRSAS